MRKQQLIFIVFFSISNLYAQDIFIQAGKNITSYDFVTNQPLSPSPPDYRVGTGNFYEIGFSPKRSVKEGPIQNVTYLASLTYNEFNAEASKDLNSYAWKTSYVGLQNVIDYSFFKTKTGIKLSLNAGLNAATIIKGDQFINNVFYDLTTNEDFSGLTLQGIVGLNSTYPVSNYMTCNLGCNYSKAYNNTISSEITQLTINTLQFKFGLHYLLKQKLDDDNDGIVNEEDKCPNVAGLKTFNGCPDTDGDGVQNSEDKCPNVSGISEFNGCPDSDKDGVQDSEDKCPLMAGSKEGEGCPDSDGDGVYDHKDVCPVTAGPATNKGCPEIKEEVKEKIRIASTGIYFESGTNDFSPISYANLDLLAGIIQEYMEASVMIEGHTDNQGEDDANLILSQKRADAVKAYIVSKGVNEDRMTAIGFGETTPVADNSENSGRILNRRVDVNVKLLY